MSAETAKETPRIIQVADEIEPWYEAAGASASPPRTHAQYPWPRYIKVRARTIAKATKSHGIELAQEERIEQPSIVRYHGSKLCHMSVYGCPPGSDGSCLSDWRAL